MAYKTCKVKITGLGPMLQHNKQLGDPLHEGTRLIKAITAKKAKTEADLHELSRLEFTYGLYMSEDGPIIPAHQIHGLLIDAAKKSKLGKEAKAGIVVDRAANIEYKGPRTAPEMYKAGKYVHIEMKKQTGKLIRRTRPKFEDWSATLVFDYDNEIVSDGNLNQILAMAPRCGIGDDRPIKGKFEVKRI